MSLILPGQEIISRHAVVSQCSYSSDELEWCTYLKSQTELIFPCVCTMRPFKYDKVAGLSAFNTMLLLCLPPPR